jgi:hypothetical protein
VIIDDFVMLGKTVPEVSADGRQFVCTAGYSLEMRQPVRIYPMARRGSPPRWSVSRIPVERNPKDSRAESWKIRGDRASAAHDRINEVIVPVLARADPATQRKIVAALTVSSLREANERRLSLCVVLPTEVPRLRFEAGRTAEMQPTPDMFGAPSALPVRERFAWHPRLCFSDKGGAHDLMLREWGCYELLRKHGDAWRYQLDTALHLDRAPPLLCGNLSNQRTAWLVIAVLSGAVHARPDIGARQPSLFAPPEARPQPALA